MWKRTTEKERMWKRRVIVVKEMWKNVSNVEKKCGREPLWRMKKLSQTGKSDGRTEKVHLRWKVRHSEALRNRKALRSEEWDGNQKR